MSRTTPTGISSPTSNGYTAKDGTADTAGTTRVNDASENTLAACLQDGDSRRRRADCGSEATGGQMLEQEVIEGAGQGDDWVADM